MKFDTSVSAVSPIARFGKPAFFVFICSPVISIICSPVIAPVVLCDNEVMGEMTGEQMIEQLERWAVE